MNRIGNRPYSRYEKVPDSGLAWKPLRKLLGVDRNRPGVGLIIIILALMVGLLWMWTGHTQLWERFNESILRNWLALLILPTTVVIGVISFLVWIMHKSEQQAVYELKVAEWYTKYERQIDAERFREAAFQAYLDRMTELLLEKELRQSEPGSEVRNIARARTLVVLRGLDGAHKGILVRFLYELGLIKGEAIIDLNGADLSGADLGRAKLSEVVLSGANLSGAILTGADLRKADLQECVLVVADLSEANLQMVNLSKANLTEAVVNGINLSGANLRRADLHGANFEEADLREADLSEANLKSTVVIGANLSEGNLSGTVLHRANLHRATLRGANLHGADLSWAGLSWADLGGAELTEADMRGANLDGANVVGTTLRAVKSLKGATMPDGRKHA